LRSAGDCAAELVAYAENWCTCGVVSADAWRDRDAQVGAIEMMLLLEHCSSLSCLKTKHSRCALIKPTNVRFDAPPHLPTHQTRSSRAPNYKVETRLSDSSKNGTAYTRNVCLAANHRKVASKDLSIDLRNRWLAQSEGLAITPLAAARSYQ
jgi:hypothetical protein